VGLHDIARKKDKTQDAFIKTQEDRCGYGLVIGGRVAVQKATEIEHVLLRSHGQNYPDTQKKDPLSSEKKTRCKVLLSKLWKSVADTVLLMEGGRGSKGNRNRAYITEKPWPKLSRCQKI
jgi:hypothetical protein